MKLDQIAEQLTGIESKYPPVELWDPAYCGELDIEIKKDGSWHYNGSAFKRMPLVKLFASVLKKEDDAFFLVTPVEKIKIMVEDAPYVITQWQWQDEQQKNMIVATQLGDELVLNADHPMRIDEDGHLYVVVRRNLEAKVHRNVYYQWVDLAEEVKDEQGHSLIFRSGGETYQLGHF